jgi:lysophospholipase L1-like esterase
VVSGAFTDDDAGARSGEQDAEGPESPTGGPIPRRTVLRFGTVAAAGAGAAALIPAAAARADTIADPHTELSSQTMNEAFGGVWAPPRTLDRWMCSRSQIRHIVCVGDSITSGKVGGFNYSAGGKGSWTERFATAAGHAIGPDAGFGFRGLWLRNGWEPEWSEAGTWTPTTVSDSFDVCPWGEGLRSSGGPSNTLSWTRPSPVSVAGFDLYWFKMAGAGNWQYRVDNGAWVNMNQSLSPADNKLHKFYVGQPVQTRVDIRAFNGSVPCLAPIGGIGIYSVDPNTTRGLIVHNLGAGARFLSDFVHASSGNRLAWFDAVVSNPVSLAFKPDLVIAMFSNDVVHQDTTVWKADLTKLVNRVRWYSDVVLMNPYERGGFSTTVQAQFRSATRDVVNARRCALFDIYNAYAGAGATGWQAADNAGLMFDNLHPSQLGHVDIAARVWRMLRTVS